MSCKEDSRKQGESHILNVIYQIIQSVEAERRQMARLDRLDLSKETKQ